MLFYDSPAIWQGLNAAVICGLVAAITRRFGFSARMQALLVISVIFGGNVTRFSNTAEDVFLNLALVFGVLLLLLIRRPVLLGLGLAILILGRPQFVLLIGVLILAELLVEQRRTGKIATETVRYLATIVVPSVVVTVGFQVLFQFIGERHFFRNGQIIYSAAIDKVEAREIDGFIVFPWSGSYALHLMWTLPSLLLLLAVAGFLRSRHLERDHEVLAYFCAGSTVAMLLVHEARPLLYFNVRYVTYLLPFVYVLAWISAMPDPTTTRAVNLDPETRDESAPRLRPRALLAALALLAPFSIPSEAVELKNKLESRAEVELLDIRDEFRNVASGRMVVVDMPQSSSANYVSYVLRRPPAEVQTRSERDPQPGDTLVLQSTGQSSAIPGLEPTLSTKSMQVFVVPESGVTLPPG